MRSGFNDLMIILPYILIIATIVLALIVIYTAVQMLQYEKGQLIGETVDVNEATPKDTGVERITVAFEQIQGARENQQDTGVVLKNGKTALAVVADGMGGLQNGAEISGIVSYVFKENFQKIVQGAYPEMELLEVAGLANEQACSYISSLDAGQSGSTLVAVLIKKEQLYFLAIGDSCIFLKRDGQLIKLNREHIYAYELDENVINNEMSYEQALTNRERKSLTSYIGMGNIRHVDRNIEPICLCKGDAILLASDGVFGTLSEQEMVEALVAETPDMAAKNLVERVQEKAKPRQDNASAAVVFVG